MKLQNENCQVFKTRRVRYARADELELYSSSTTLPVKRRNQLPGFILVHALSVDEHKHSPARVRCSKFVHYVQNYRHRTDVVVCWRPKFHGFNLAPLFHSIKGRGKFC